MLRYESCWPAKLAVGSQNLACQVAGKPGPVDDLPGALGFSRQRTDIGGVQVIEFSMQTLPRAGLVQHVAIGLGGDGEPVRDADAPVRQLLEHLPERCVLAADERHDVDAHLLEKADVAGRTHDRSSRCAFSIAVRRLSPHTAPPLTTSL